MLAIRTKNDLTNQQLKALSYKPHVNAHLSRKKIERQCRRFPPPSKRTEPARNPILQYRSAMHIVHMTSAHPWSDTRIFSRMAASLAEAGHQVDLIAAIDQTPPESHCRGVNVVAVRPSKSRWGRMTGVCWQVFIAARRVKADIYHFHDPELIPVGLLLRALGARVVYDIHEHVVSEIAEKTYIPKLLRGGVAWSVRHLSGHAIRRFSGIVTAGEDITESISALAARIATISNYPDLRVLDEVRQASADSTTSARSPYIVFFGGVRPNNVAVNIVQSLEHIAPERELTLILGGLVHDQTRRELLEHLPGWARTEFLGHIGYTEMLGLTQGAQCALILYANEANAQNIRSNRLFESLAMGVPVIVPNFPLWQEFISTHQCGIAVDPDSPQQISSAILDLIGNPDQAKEMGRRGREAVERHWNWGCEFPKLTALYDQILSDSDTSSRTDSK